MPRDHVSDKVLQKKLKKFFTLTLDTNNDGLVNWTDFESAIENLVPKEDAEKNSRLKILRKRVEQNYQKYFWDLCSIGDANNDGNIDLDEWLDVMNDIIFQLKETGKFPEWYEGLHKAMFRAHEFMDDKNISKGEFADLLATWDIDEDSANKAYVQVTDTGKKKMDYNLFSECLKKFFLDNTPGAATNLGLD